MQLRRTLAILFVAISLAGLPDSASAKSAVASSDTFGIGVQLGWPGNGLSMNYFLTPSTSLQVDVSLWLDGDWSGLGARVDFLFWQDALASGSVCDLVWYFGPGGNIFSFNWQGKHKENHDSYLGLGVEFPVGLGVRFVGAPIDINLEAVPILHIVGSNGTSAEFGIAGVLNARYYF